MNIPFFINRVTDATGAHSFDPSSLPTTIVRNNGNVASVTVGPDANGNSFQQTYSYPDANTTVISAWVKL